jgi:hypothetical protein
VEGGIVDIIDLLITPLISMKDERMSIIDLLITPLMTC